MEQFKNKVIQGDCLEVMKDIPDGSVDMILADLCILCFKCGYDEREIKHNNADTLKAWQKIADNRMKQKI